MFEKMIIKLLRWYTAIYAGLAIAVGIRAALGSALGSWSAVVGFVLLIAVFLLVVCAFIWLVMITSELADKLEKKK
jgi:presenilin-like A22 family membrane protease